MTGPPPREWHATIASTQERAVVLARAGTPAGTRVVAGQQTAGRGRLDHAWASPPGGLYLSLVFPSPALHPSLLPPAIGAVLAESLEHRFGVPLVLKWPNDVLTLSDDGARVRKLAGTLVDRVPTAAGDWAVVAGVGVNVAPTLSLAASVAGEAVALAELVRPPPTVAEVEELSAQAVAAAVAFLADEAGSSAARELCQRRLFGVGRTAVVDGVPVGRIDSLGPDGELWVKTESGRVAIRAGDLRVGEAP